MKVSVSYGNRTYGNGEPSRATEVRISGSRTKVTLDVAFKESMSGRSWDWLSAGSVGGAKLEMPLEDAMALAQAIQDFAAALESHDPLQESMRTLVRMREGHLPTRAIVREPHIFK